MQDFHEIEKLKKGYIAKLKELEKALSEYPVYGEKMSTCERDYRVAKQIVTLEQKQEGMQATLIPTIVNGAVADERLKFKIAETQFHACRENIKRLHANLDAYRSLLSTAKSEINIR
jgi:hypothetical protein